MRPPSLARDRSYSASDLIRDHIAFAPTGRFGAGSRLGLPSHVSRKDRSVAQDRADEVADYHGAEQRVQFGAERHRCLAAIGRAESV
jgi:hypothetical protein